MKLIRRIRLWIEKRLISIIQYLHSKSWVEYTALCNHSITDQDKSSDDEVRYCGICWMVSNIKRITNPNKEQSTKTLRETRSKPEYTDLEGNKSHVHDDSDLPDGCCGGDSRDCCAL